MAKLFCSKVSHNPYKEEMLTEITEKVFQVDGYSVGDRLLEGVLFDVYFDGDKVTKVKVDESCEDYYNDLNTKKWNKAVKEHAEDILSEGDEVDVPDFIKAKYFKNGINVAFIVA